VYYFQPSHGCIAIPLKSQLFQDLLSPNVVLDIQALMSHSSAFGPQGVSPKLFWISFTSGGNNKGGGNSNRKLSAGMVRFLPLPSRIVLEGVTKLPKDVVIDIPDETQSVQLSPPCRTFEAPQKIIA
jgi:hypothetical protein